MGGRKNFHLFFSCGLGLALAQSAAADYVGIAAVAQGRTVSGTVDVHWRPSFNEPVVVTPNVFIEFSFGCDADLDGDGEVNAFDLAQLLGNWGPCSGCPADLNSDGVVNAADLAMLLGAWGPCS